VPVTHAARGRAWVARAVVCLVLAACGVLPPRGPRKSQPALVQQRLGRTTLTLRYNRPSARGRTLFGDSGVVPYGREWDPGADEATTLAVTRTVTFGGQPLAAGRYSVWAIPRPDRWTIILSRAANVQHTPYPAGRDALRLDVAPTTGPYVETLAYGFPVADEHHAVLELRWGTTGVEIPIDTR
jgi:DUF2911 family protein